MADRVTVIGWDGSPLTDVARSALAAATLVAGAAHHLALPEVPPHAERIRLGSASSPPAASRGTAARPSSSRTATPASSASSAPSAPLNTAWRSRSSPPSPPSPPPSRAPACPGTTPSSWWHTRAPCAAR